MTRDTKEVQKLLSCLNANKSCGVDKIPARLLKETADTSAVPLRMLFNLSFKQGRLPKLWKSANITPIHKDGDQEPVENYRRRAGRELCTMLFMIKLLDSYMILINGSSLVVPALLNYS